jgi:hypothetical protein
MSLRRFRLAMMLDRRTAEGIKWLPSFVWQSFAQQGFSTNLPQSETGTLLRSTG